MLSTLTWCGDLMALVTALALLKDTHLGRASGHDLLSALRGAGTQLRTGHGVSCLIALRPPLRFCIRVGLLVLVAASAGLCVVFPGAGQWPAMLLRTALALHMASQVPCPWIRWISVGDTRAKLNDPPGVERRVQR